LCQQQELNERKEELYMKSKNNSNKSYHTKQPNNNLRKQEDFWFGSTGFKKCTELIIRSIDT
jgi:cell shape-determining protein MreC